jgi:glycine dehydrogenase subunit 2
MIEPTETEPKHELDIFCDALIDIAREVEEDPDMVHKAPHLTRTPRVDEVAAARKPVVRWTAPAPVSQAAD